MANSVSKALINKYLDNCCTPEEAALVQLYLQQPGSDAVLDTILAERLGVDMQQSMDTPDDAVQKAAWRTQIRERMGRSAPVRIWRYAAVTAAILAGFGAFTIYRIHTKATTQQGVALLHKDNPNGQRSVIRLHDGSVIYLGAGSRLDYPETFTGSRREISLTGEAFFEITQDPKHPFVVRSGNIATTVLGTSFHISAFSGKPLSVAVATGKVRVDYQDGANTHELATLQQGKQVTWNSGRVVLAAADVADIEGWRKGRLVFNNQALQDVAADLERWYNVKISFKHAGKAQEKITVRLYGSAPLDKTLQTLAAGSDFKYTVKGREVLIY